MSKKRQTSTKILTVSLVDDSYTPYLISCIFIRKAIQSHAWKFLTKILEALQKKMQNDNTKRTILFIVRVVLSFCIVFL